jgi:uncharacterized protein YcfJ
MVSRNKILPIAIVALLLGGTVGAFIAHRSSQTVNTQPATTANNTTTPVVNPDNNQTADQIKTAAEEAANQPNSTSQQTTEKTVVVKNEPVRSSYNNTRRVYYDYNNQPAKRTFWQKHRDKMTVAMGTGGGALLGAIIGGGKGAAIGALAGGGGSALYTYKLRKRQPNY